MLQNMQYTLRRRRVQKRHRRNRGKNAVDGLPIGGIFCGHRIREFREFREFRERIPALNSLISLNSLIIPLEPSATLGKNAVDG